MYQSLGNLYYCFDLATFWLHLAQQEFSSEIRQLKGEIYEVLTGCRTLYMCCGLCNCVTHELICI